MAGKKIVEGYTFIFDGFLADQQYVQQAFQLKRFLAVWLRSCFRS